VGDGAQGKMCSSLLSLLFCNNIKNTSDTDFLLP